MWRVKHRQSATWKKALTQPWWNLDLELPASKTVRNKALLLINHPVCGMLLHNSQRWLPLDFRPTRQALLGLHMHCQHSFALQTARVHAIDLERANIDSLLKIRDITLLTKVHLVKVIVFPVVIYWCENWTTKKAGCRRIDTFELSCWRRLLWVPWTARRSN